MWNRLTEGEWIKVTNLSALYEILQWVSYAQTKYRIDKGSTGIGSVKLSCFKLALKININAAVNSIYIYLYTCNSFSGVLKNVGP